MIALDQVTFDYGAWRMRFDLSVDKGDFLVAIGPSGAGKSTLLNLIAGFDAPSGGRVLLDRVDMTRAAPAKRPVTTLFQDHNLFAHLTVAANVGLGRNPGLRLSRDDKAAVSAALAEVGLTGFEDRLPAALSGGERQRVALARSLVRQKPILLLDEPFAALGPAQRRRMASLVDRLRREHGLTVLLVTHQLDEVAGTGLPAIFIEGGRIAARGTVDEFLTQPPTPEIAAYLGTGRADPADRAPSQPAGIGGSPEAGIGGSAEEDHGHHREERQQDRE